MSICKVSIFGDALFNILYFTFSRSINGDKLHLGKKSNDRFLVKHCFFRKVQLRKEEGHCYLVFLKNLLGIEKLGK